MSKAAADQMHKNMMVMFAGENTLDCAEALCRSLSAVVIIAANNPDNADQLIADAAKLMQGYVRKNWKLKSKLSQRTGSSALN